MTHAVDVRRRERVAEEREDVTLELLEALSKLRSEVKALRPFEFEVRAEIGNTNWACLMQRLEEAEAAIAKAEALNREGKR